MHSSPATVPGSSLRKHSLTLSEGANRHLGILCSDWRYSTDTATGKTARTGRRNCAWGAHFFWNNHNSSGPPSHRSSQHNNSPSAATATATTTTEPRAQMGRNYYEVLGLPKGTSDAAQIKKAYRKKALQSHPDRGGDTAKFQGMYSSTGNCCLLTIYSSGVLAIFAEHDQHSSFKTPALRSHADETIRPVVMTPASVRSLLVCRSLMFLYNILEVCPSMTSTHQPPFF